jgi:hypothetical protein
MGKVHVTMTVTTGQYANQSDAQRFAISTLADWLTKNANRPEVPYQIQLEPNPVKRSGFTEAPKPDPNAALQPGGLNAPPGRGAIPAAGGRRGAAPAGEDTRPMLMGRPTGGGGDSPGTPLTAPSGPSDQTTAAAASAVRSLAPLTAPVSTETGATTTFTVSWDAVLLPKPTAPGGAS